MTEWPSDQVTKWPNDRVTGSFADDWPYGIFVKQMIWRSHWMLMSLYVSSVSVWDVLKIYTPWKQRNSFKLIPSRREKVLFICTEWADISKRNYMNRLFLVRLRPVQSPEVIMHHPGDRSSGSAIVTHNSSWKPRLWRWKADLDFISIDENIFPIDWILFLSAVPVVSHLIPNTKLLYPSMIESLKMLKMQW